MRPCDHLLALALSSVLLLGCSTGEGAGEGSAEGPKLVALIVIDQLRPDLLDRYEFLFTGGLRRVLDKGHRFTNATHDHANTFTGPGHATLATGVHPTKHGIVANDWSELRDGEWRRVYSMADSTAGILGFPEMAGRSPANLDRGGLGDWISSASPDARVVSISRKDRSAIGLAGKAVGEVYWMVDPFAGFITSSYYHSEYPEWISRFNAEVMPGIYADTVWESRVPENAEHLTRSDTSAFERPGAPSFFPHRASQRVDLTDSRALTTWRSRTPAPDAAVMGLARAAMTELELGQRSVVDYLALSFSQIDRIGHNYGPMSREQLDNLIHLDAVLEELFQLFDDAVGPEGWVAGFSADHGMLDIPEHLAERGVDAMRLGQPELVEFREAVADAVAGGAEGEALAVEVKSAIQALPFVERAYTFAEVEDPQARPDTFAVLFSRFSRVPNVFTCNLSKLAGHSEVKSHAGESTSYIRCHLGVEVPARAPSPRFMSAGRRRHGKRARCWRSAMGIGTARTTAVTKTATFSSSTSCRGALPGTRSSSAR